MFGDTILRNLDCWWPVIVLVVAGIGWAIIFYGEE
jgi:hypothetical protein